MEFRYSGRHGSGYQRVARAQRRIDAELRAEDTTHERTRKHRLNKCQCEPVEALAAV